MSVAAGGGGVLCALTSTRIQPRCYTMPQPLSSGGGFIFGVDSIICIHIYMSHCGIRWLLALPDIPWAISPARVTQLSLNEWTHKCSRLYGSCAIRNIFNIFCCTDMRNWGIKYREFLSRFLPPPFPVRCGWLPRIWRFLSQIWTIITCTSYRVCMHGEYKVFSVCLNTGTCFLYKVQEVISYVECHVSICLSTCLISETIKWISMSFCIGILHKICWTNLLFVPIHWTQLLPYIELKSNFISGSSRKKLTQNMKYVCMFRYYRKLLLKAFFRGGVYYKAKYCDS